MELNIIGIQAGNFNVNLNVGQPLNFLPAFGNILSRETAQLCTTNKNDIALANVQVYNNVQSLRYNYLNNLNLIQKYRNQLLQLQQHFLQQNTNVFAFERIFNNDFCEFNNSTRYYLLRYD